MRVTPVLDGGGRCCWPEWELWGSRHVSAVYGRGVPARLEGAGRAAAGRRLGALHRDHECEDLPALRQGTAAATAATGSPAIGSEKRENPVASSLLSSLANLSVVTADCCDVD